VGVVGVVGVAAPLPPPPPQLDRVAIKSAELSARWRKNFMNE
jgi:hypothetical protein